jgi:hypothetical protein
VAVVEGFKQEVVLLPSIIADDNFLIAEWTTLSP